MLKAVLAEPSNQEPSLRDLFSDLSEEQLNEVEETFHDYLAVVWDIYQELKRERPEIFDKTGKSS
jgi:hypothetical protein